jgi:hypothetical protein
LAPALGAVDAFGVGVCAYADIEPAKKVNANAIIKNNFITISSNIVFEIEISN